MMPPISARATSLCKSGSPFDETQRITFFLPAGCRTFGGEVVWSPRGNLWQPALAARQCYLHTLLARVISSENSGSGASQG